MYKRQLSDRSYQLFTENVHSFSFEKCTELVSFHRERYLKIVESKELSTLVKEKIAFFVKWKDLKIERYVRGFIALLRYEIINYGYSDRLSQLGTFFAIHNRQGNSDIDWISGADIFLKSEYETINSTKLLGKFIRPVLRSSCEPFEVHFGKAIAFFSLNPSQIMSEMELSEKQNLTSSLESPIMVSVFKDSNQNGTDIRLIFCTDGLREMACKTEGLGSEFVFQFVPNRLADLIEQDYRDIAARSLTLAWLLLKENNGVAPKIGDGLNCDLPLVKGNANNELTSVFLTQFKLMPREQLSSGGKFIYLNLALLFKDEAKVVADLGPEKLLPLLERRGLDQGNREGRSSIFGKSGRLVRNDLYVSISD